MIKRLYKRIKTAVDIFSTGQKLFAILAIILGFSLAGNMYQSGQIATQEATIKDLAVPAATVCRCNPEIVYVDKPPKVTERIIERQPIYNKTQIIHTKETTTNTAVLCANVMRRHEVEEHNKR